MENVAKEFLEGLKDIKSKKPYLWTYNNSEGFNIVYQSNTLSGFENSTVSFADNIINILNGIYQFSYMEKFTSEMNKTEISHDEKPIELVKKYTYEKVKKGFMYKEVKFSFNDSYAFSISNITNPVADRLVGLMDGAYHCGGNDAFFVVQNIKSKIKFESSVPEPIKPLKLI